jgi:hypothetical protein
MTYGTALAALAALGVLLGSAAAQPQVQDRTRLQTQEQIQDRDIYGYQLMTPEERAEYRSRMRAANSFEERERIRAEHYARMQERAQERGLTLPEQPRYGGPGTRDRGGARGPRAGGTRGGR